MREYWSLATRYLTTGLLFFLPKQKRIAIERRLRGKEEFRKLKRADWVLMSWGKSGRTWFRLMISRFYQIRYGLPENRLLEFDNLHRRNSGVPRVLFSHNNYLRDYLRDWDTLNHFRGRKVVLLVRDPRDVAVSQFFQWQFRMRPHKKLLNDYPPHGSEISAFDFVRNPDCGIPRIVAWMNGWAQGLRDMGDDVLLIRYEDMRTDPNKVIHDVLEFTGTPGTAQEVQECVDFAAYDNMKKMEQKQTFWLSGARIKPGDQSNPDSFKVRKAKVGGFRDYFSDDELAAIDNMMSELDPVFGYRS